MVTVKREGIILEGTLLEFENEGVMNPAVMAEGNTDYFPNHLSAIP